MPEHAVKTRRRPGTGWLLAARAKVAATVEAKGTAAETPTADATTNRAARAVDARSPAGAPAVEVDARSPAAAPVAEVDAPSLEAAPVVEVNPRIEQRRREVQKAQTQRRLRILRAVVIAAVAALLADALLHSPLLDVRRPRVSGQVQTSPDDILRVGGLLGHPLMITLDLRRSAAAIERLPWIATARVRRSWPDTVIVTVTERAPVAIVVADLVDATGRVLSPAPGFAPLLPVRIDAGSRAPALPPPGATVPPVYRPGVEVAATMPAQLRALVQAILVRPDGTVRLALTSGNSVLLGDTTELAAKFESALTILERVQIGRAPIDVSVPSAPVLLTSPAAAATVSTHTGG